MYVCVCACIYGVIVISIIFWILILLLDSMLLFFYLQPRIHTNVELIPNLGFPTKNKTKQSKNKNKNPNLYIQLEAFLEDLVRPVYIYVPSHV